MKKHLLVLGVIGLILAIVGTALALYVEFNQLPYLEISVITACAGGIFLLVSLGVYLVSLVIHEIQEIKGMAWDIPLQD